MVLLMVVLVLALQPPALYVPEPDIKRTGVHSPKSVVATATLSRN